MTGDTPMFSNNENENDNDEEFMFQDEVEETSSQSSSDVWHILIVDDEPQVHQVTEMVLKNFEFNNKSLKFYNGHLLDSETYIGGTVEAFEAAAN